MIPNVCDIVEYGLDSFGKGAAAYRVEGWLRPHLVQPTITGDDMLLSGAMWRDLTTDQIADALIHAIVTDEPSRGVRLAWCKREEATHVALSGICGAIGRASECKVVGRVQWAEETIAEAADRAQRLAETGRLTDAWITPAEAAMLAASIKH